MPTGSRYIIIVTSVALIIGAVLIAGLSNMANENKKSLTYWVSPHKPTSLDPLLYDFTKHHPIQSLVHCTLTSLYRGPGSVTPELAKSWKESEGGAQWSFEIRDDLVFSDGTPVNVNNSLKSLKRIFFLLHKQNSKYRFVQKLSGISQFENLEQEFDGISVIDNKVVFKFDEPIRNFHEAISFGIFAVVHPSHYDSKNGAWKLDGLSAISGCGPYRVIGESENQVRLVKKQDYPQDLIHSKAFEELIQTTQASESSPADIMNGGPKSEILQKTHRYYPNGGRAINYFRVFTWPVKGSFWSDVENRRYAREKLYQNLEKNSVEFTRSFFPLSMPGISEPKRDSVEENFSSIVVPKAEVTFDDPHPVGHSGPKHPVFQSIENTLQELGFKLNGKRGVTIEQLTKNRNPKRKTFDIDIANMGTGISLEDPESDVRLMFSEEGIFLPDPTGKITEELKKAKINIQMINQQLYDDAIIWPVSITSRGVWVRQDLDLSDYNTLKPLGELQWIGQK